MSTRKDDSRFDSSRTIRAPHGPELSCRTWLTEAPFRMLQNNLDPDVAENPAALVVYGGIGRAARDCWHSMLRLQAPASDAASGCAPPMPPKPAVRIHLPVRSPS